MSCISNSVNSEQDKIRRVKKCLCYRPLSQRAANGPRCCSCKWWARERYPRSGAVPALGSGTRARERYPRSGVGLDWQYHWAVCTVYLNQLLTGLRRQQWHFEFWNLYFSQSPHRDTSAGRTCYFCVPTAYWLRFHFLRGIFFGLYTSLPDSSPPHSLLLMNPPVNLVV